MLLPESWKTLQRAPTMHQVELEPTAIARAVRRHPKDWCVAAFRCVEPTGAGRLNAVDDLVRHGVAAMLSVRHDAAWPDHLAACAALPVAVHDHRRDSPQHPVALLWDDADFIPRIKK